MSIGGESLPICTRCGCIYAGVLLTYALASIDRRISVPWSVGIALVSILFVEWLTANTGLRESSDISRGLAGFSGGAGGVIVLLLHHGQTPAGRYVAVGGLAVAGAALATSINTAALLLILCSFFLFWIKATQVVVQIVSSTRNEGEYHENESPA